jgi:hypothetical protein
MKKSLRYLAALSVFVAGVVSAQPTVTGLGQAWPYAPDMSSSSNYHVYVFDKNGVRFIQVNDRSGHIHGAVAIGEGFSLVLPVGSRSDIVIESADPASPSSIPQERVYRDERTQIIAQPQSNGLLKLRVIEACKDPVWCNTTVEY